MRAQFVDRGKPHHAFGHLRLDRAVGIQRIGHAIDDARFEHRHRRLILVVRGGHSRSVPDAPAAGSVKVDGARPAARVAAALPRLAPVPTCGQASSNVGGVNRLVRPPSGAPVRGPRISRRTIGCPRLGALALPSARTRKTADCAAASSRAAAGAGPGGGSWRGRSRTAVSFKPGGGVDMLAAGPALRCGSMRQRDCSAGWLRGAVPVAGCGKPVPSPAARIRADRRCLSVRAHHGDKAKQSSSRCSQQPRRPGSRCCRN